MTKNAINQFAHQIKDVKMKISFWRNIVEQIRQDDTLTAEDKCKCYTKICSYAIKSIKNLSLCSENFASVQSTIPYD